MEEKKKGKQGFASMDKEKQREIAQKGGKVAHEKGLAHKWNKEEASEAGKKGGKAKPNQG
jgi:general stress protein YciG